MQQRIFTVFAMMVAAFKRVPATAKWAGVSATILVTATGAFAGPLEELSSAVRQLQEASNYGWEQVALIATHDAPPLTKSGVTEKAGFTVITENLAGHTIQAVRHGNDKFVRQLMDGRWQTAAERRAVLRVPGNSIFGAGGASRNPDEDLAALLSQLVDFSSVDDAITATITADGVKERYGNISDRYPVRDVFGAARFWLRNGQLVRYELHLKATFTVKEVDQPRDTKITVTIKDVDTTTVTPPEEALRKLGF